MLLKGKCTLIHACTPSSWNKSTVISQAKIELRRPCMYPEEVASASGAGLYTCRCFFSKLVSANDSCIRHGILHVLTADSSAAGPIGNRLKSASWPASIVSTGTSDTSLVTYNCTTWARVLRETAKHHCLIQGAFHAGFNARRQQAGVMSALQVRIRCGAVGIRHRPAWRYLQHRSNCSS